MKTAPHAFFISDLVYKPTFSRLSGGHSTCSKLLGLLTPFNMSLEVPKKVLVILVHQGAAKLPALKVFVASKLENLLHRMLFLSVKNV